MKPLFVLVSSRVHAVVDYRLILNWAAYLNECIRPAGLVRWNARLHRNVLTVCAENYAGVICAVIHMFHRAQFHALSGLILSHGNSSRPKWP